MTISLHRIWKPNRFRTFTPLALALLLLISPGCDATSPAENNTDTQVNDRYINVNGVELHYREWGHADAPPLVLLHGITGHAWEFDSVAAALADQYRVLVVNQRGHGASTHSETYSPEIMADDIAAFVDALGLDRIQLIGHSMGGVNGWWFAARYPERVERLVILDIEPEVITNADVIDAFTGVLDYYAQARYADPENAVEEYLTGYTGFHKEELRTFVLNNLREHTDGQWTWRFDADGLKSWFEAASASKETHVSMLRKVSAPTLVVRAGDSPFTTAPAIERMAQEMPQAQKVEIPDSGHDVHIDQRAALLTELRSFLTPQP